MPFSLLYKQGPPGKRDRRRGILGHREIGRDTTGFISVVGHDAEVLFKLGDRYVSAIYSVSRLISVVLNGLPSGSPLDRKL
jgi:hypothetical protein